MYANKPDHLDFKKARKRRPRKYMLKFMLQGEKDLRNSLEGLGDPRRSRDAGWPSQHVHPGQNN